MQNITTTSYSITYDGLGINIPAANHSEAIEKIIQLKHRRLNEDQPNIDKRFYIVVETVTKTYIPYISPENKFPGSFEAKHGICYINEAGKAYTYADYLKIAKNNEALAKRLFLLSEWQHVETILEELINEKEIDENGNILK